MMKRPRSFISTLFIFFCLATVSLGLTTYSRPAQASSLPRLMDPRAGDPDEPGLALPASNQELADPSIIRADGHALRLIQPEQAPTCLGRIFRWLGIAAMRFQSWQERR